MRGKQGRFGAGVLVVPGALALVLWVGAATTTARAAAGRAGVGTIDSFSATLHIRRGVLGAAESRLGTATPTVTYRLDRRRRGDRWLSVFTTTSPTRPPFVAPSGKDEAVPPEIVRVEDAGDGSPLRYFAADREIDGVDRLRSALRGTAPLGMLPAGTAPQGNPWAAGGDVPPQMAAGADWIEAVLPSRAASAARRLALRERFGRGTTVRGLDRFVVFAGTGTTELLADPATGLIVEVNTLEGGRLERRTMIAYADAPGDRLLRQSMSSERRLPEDDGRRERIDIVLADVRVGAGR